MRCLGLLLLTLTSADAAEPVNLALFASGGMPSALASAPDLRYSAQKACDDNTTTAWVTEAAAAENWLRVTWRYPVEVHALAFRNAADLPFNDDGPVGRYRVEVLVGGAWQAVGQGDASTVAADDWTRVELPQPVSTTAVRLVVLSSPQPRAAVAEFAAYGPAIHLPLDDSEQWQGLWIWCEPSLFIAQRQPIRRYFRRSFDLADPAQLQEVWLTACAFDSLKLWVNGHELLTQPAYAGGLLREAEVTGVPLDLLLKGDNVIAAQVEDVAEVGSHGLLCELHLIAQDGTRTVIPSDGDWFGQEDQGVVPDWRLPGLKDNRWVPVTPLRRPGARWHWLWNIPHPTLAPRDTFGLTALRFEPERPPAGTTAKLHLTLHCDAAPTTDYNLLVRLGQWSFIRSHDYELWGAELPADELKTSEWQAGDHEVTVAVPIPDAVPNPLPATLMLARPDASAALFSNLPETEITRYGLAVSFDLDQPRAKPTESGFRGTEVKSVGGAPAIVVDGQPEAPILWCSSYGNYRRYHDYAKSGVRIFRPRLEGPPIPAPGEEELYYLRWLKEVDKELQAAVAAAPDCLLVPIVEMDPNPIWLFDHPGDMLLSGRGNLVVPLSYKVPDRGQARPTFLSTAWREAGARGLRRLVSYLRDRPYADHVIGLWFFAGRAGENHWGGNEFNVFVNDQGRYDCVGRDQWDVGDFSAAGRVTFRHFLKRQYHTDEALATAWQRPGVTFDDLLDPAKLPSSELCDALTYVNRSKDAGTIRDPSEPGLGTLPMDYERCWAEALLDSHLAWGKAVKEASDGKLLTGAYYGYFIPQLWTSVPGFHGHTAIDKAFRSPYLDGFSSPIDYARRRAGSEVWGFNLPASARLHNKLYVYEFDSRTFLAEHGPKTYSRDETLAVFQRDVGKALCRQSAWWWYEFGQDQQGARSIEWFSDPAILDLASHAKQAYDDALKLPDRAPDAQIAVFLHGNSTHAQDIFSPTLQVNGALGRMTLCDQMPHVGAPFDLYELGDLPDLRQRGLLDQYRLCIFLNAFCLNRTEREEINRCKGAGRTILWMYAPGLASLEPAGLSPQNVSSLTEIAGVDWLRQEFEPTAKLTGLFGEVDLAPRVFGPGATWERFGNAISPVLYIDPAKTDRDAKVLGNWQLPGQPADQRGAFALRDRRQGKTGWASLYCAVPYLPADVLRKIAKFAGVHLYRTSGEQLDASRHFLMIHTGAQPATGPVSLPRKCEVTEVFTGQVVGKDVDSFELNLKPYSTGVWRLR